MTQTPLHLTPEESTFVREEATRLGFQKGWNPDMTARQIVDNAWRAGIDIQFKQHLVEAWVTQEGAMTTTFKPGDIVCHKATFLRSIGWYTSVPLNGRVETVDGDVLTVHWCDAPEPSRLLAINVIRYDERHLEPR